MSKSYSARGETVSTPEEDDDTRRTNETDFLLLSGCKPVFIDTLSFARREAGIYMHIHLYTKLIEKYANGGAFSELAAALSQTDIAADIDPISVEKNYTKKRKKIPAKMEHRALFSGSFKSFQRQRLGRYAIVEFIPKEDSKVQTLLATREDIFDQYTQAGFEEGFGVRYEILESEKVADSKRTIYLLKRKA